MNGSDHEGGRGKSRLVTRVFAALVRGVAAVLLLALVVVALYVGIGRLTMQFVDDYRSDIEMLLAEKLGQPVALGSVSGGWQWLDPVIKAHDLALAPPGDPDRQAGRVRSLLVRLDSVASLLRGRLVFRDLLADGLDMTVEQRPDGSVRIPGIPLANSLLLAEDTDAEVWSGQVSDWLDRVGAVLSDPFVRLSDVRLRLKTPEQNARTFLIPQVDFTYGDDRLSASGRALQPDSEQLLARFRLEGEHLFEGRFNGRLFVDVDSPRLFDALLKRYDWQQKTIIGLDMKGQGWLHYADGQLVSVNARVAIPYFQFDALGETRAPMEAINANVGWRRATADSDPEDASITPASGPESGGRNWTLDVTNLSWHWLDTTVSPMALQVTRGGDWDITGQDLAVAPLTQLLLSFLPADAETSRALATSQPSGRVENLLLHIPESSDNFDLTARFSAMAVQAYAGAPAASNVAGRIEMDAASGRVMVDAPDITVGFPRLFAGAWTFDRLATEVRWQRDEKTMRVWADKVAMDYHQKTRFEGGFELRMDNPGNDTLSLRVGVQDANASMLADFIPLKQVDDELYTWLTTAIEAAEIEEGWYFGHGSVNKDSPGGSFNSAMRYRFSGGRVRYDRNWPEVTGVAGNVVVEDNQARVTLAQGSTGGLALQPSTVTVDGGAEPAIVSIETASTITGEQLRPWLQSTPFADYAGAAGQALTLDGSVDLDLKIQLPLAEGAKPALDVGVATNASEIRFDDGPVVWEEVAADLRYQSGAGFSGDPITARFMGEPVTVSFAQSDGGDSVSVTQSGRIVVSRVLEQLEMAAIPGVSGRANYQARLGFSDSEPAALQIQSSLANLAVDWPAPIGKTIGPEADLNINVGLGDPEALRIYGYWQDRGAYNMQWRDGQFDRGKVVLGATSTGLPDKPGIEVTGDIPRLDLAAWQTALERPLPGLESAQNNSRADASPLSLVRVSIGDLHYGDQYLNDLQIDAEPRQDGWSLRLDGSRVMGDIQLPTSDSPIRVDLQHLALVVPADSQQPSVSADEKELSLDEAGVKSWPDIDFSVDALRLNDRAFGSWSLLFRPHDEALRIEQIEGKVGTLTLDGHLRWQERADGEQTQFRGELSGENLADIAPLIDGSVPLRSGKTDVQFDLAWDGSPGAFAFASTAGLISFRLDDGTLLESNNAAQIFRVFGILNSDTLMRRLQLDFSDLYEAGVAFDAISGTARLRGGTLNWEPEMQIVGPSGAFRLSGASDLVNETLDMRMVVVLPLTQNLPLAALLMGASAPVGGALFVLDKVLGDPLSKLTSATYQVGGTWTNPRVTLRNVFDTGN